MNQPTASFTADIRAEWLCTATQMMAARLGAWLSRQDDEVLRSLATRLPRDAAEPGKPTGPLARLIGALRPTSLEIDLFVLAGLAESWPDCATAFARLSPTNRPWPTLALAEALLGGPPRRTALRDAVASGPLVSAGALAVAGAAPTTAADLMVPPNVWTLAGGGHALLPPLSAAPTGAPLAGLEEWLNTDDARLIASCLQQFRPVSIIVTAPTAEAALHRGLALGVHAGCPLTPVKGPATADSLHAAQLQGILTGRPICLMLEDASQVCLPPEPGLPLVIACPERVPPNAGETTALQLHAEPLASHAHASMWQSLAPDLPPEAIPLLAHRHPVEPFMAERILRDTAFRHGTDTSPDPAHIGSAFRARVGARLPAGTTRKTPRACWDQLVLPAQQRSQLRDAVHRIDAQPKVLDDWNLRGPRGVRVMLSGPPGTGKTLSAEVLATALGVDLIIADLGQILSKWVGETEKNLAKLFDEAEAMRAVLFFDEAEALFGKRTEVNDAQDRFANLETAFLLNRLDRYDGLAVLATNFRRAIDAAFVRRLDHIIELREPTTEDRVRLWRTHLPSTAPLAPDVDLDLLARLYPMVGGEIRNACLSAAYLAAHEGCAIGRSHLAQAVRREFDKAGRPFREIDHV